MENLRITEGLLEGLDEIFREGYDDAVKDYNPNLYYKFNIEIKNNEIVDGWWSEFSNEGDTYVDSNYFSIYTIAGRYLEEQYDLFNKDIYTGFIHILKEIGEYDDYIIPGGYDDEALSDDFEKYKEFNNINITELIEENTYIPDLLDVLEESFDNIEII